MTASGGQRAWLVIHDCAGGGTQKPDRKRAALYTKLYQKYLELGKALEPIVRKL